jgi:lysophospholipase L1-like esterase
MTRKHTGLGLASVIVGVLVALSAAEVAARWFSLAPSPQGQYGGYGSDPYLPYKPVPGSRLRGQTEEFAYDYEHNDLGFRDAQHSWAKGPGEFRILGLGDSFTYGVGVALPDTYLSRLEAMLNAREGTHPRVEVIKAGIPRFYPEPERILLERYGVQFRPDLILVGFLPNDVIDTYLGLDAVRAGKSGYLMTREARELGRMGTLLYRYSHVGRLLVKGYVDWWASRQHRPRGDEVFRDGGFHEPDWRKVEVEFDRMASIVDSVGAKLVVLHIPQKGPWTDESRYPAVRFSAWAARQGVSFVDILPAMVRASDRERLYYQNDGHCTAAGHAVIARELYAKLLDQGLVP